MIGSAHIFSDQYLDKEDNGKLQEILWKLMTSDDITLNTIDAEDPDVCHSLTTPPIKPRPLRYRTTISCQEQVSRLRRFRAAFKNQRRYVPLTFPSISLTSDLCRCRESSQVSLIILSSEWISLSSPTPSSESPLSHPHTITPSPAGPSLSSL